MLAADLYRGGHIEYGLFAIAGDTRIIDKLSYLLRSLGLHIAVEQERCVVLVVVSQAREVRLMPLGVRRVNEPLQVEDEVG